MAFAGFSLGTPLLGQNYDTSFSNVEYDRKTPPTTWHGGAEVETSTGAVRVNLPIGKGIGSRGVHFAPVLKGRWAPQASNSYGVVFNGRDKVTHLGSISFEDPCGIEVTSPGYLKLAVSTAAAVGRQQHFLLPSGVTGAISTQPVPSGVDLVQILKDFGYSGTPTKAQVGTNHELILYLPPDSGSSLADPVQVKQFEMGVPPWATAPPMAAFARRILVVDGEGATATEYQFDGAFYQKPHVEVINDQGTPYYDIRWQRLLDAGKLQRWQLDTYTLYNVVYRAVAVRNRFGDALRFSYASTRGPEWNQVSWYPKGTDSASSFSLLRTTAASGTPATGLVFSDTYHYSGEGVEESYTLVRTQAWPSPNSGGRSFDYVADYADGTQVIDDTYVNDDFDLYEPAPKLAPTSLTNDASGETITWAYATTPTFTYGSWTNQASWLAFPQTGSGLTVMTSMSFPGRTVYFRGWTVYPYSRNHEVIFADDPNRAYNPISQAWTWGVTQVDEVDSATQSTRTTLHNRTVPIPAWVNQDPANPTQFGASNTWSTTAFQDRVTHPDGSISALTFASPNAGNALTGLPGFLQNQAFAKQVEVRREEYAPPSFNRQGPYATTVMDRFDLHTTADPNGDPAFNATPTATRKTTWDADSQVLTTVEQSNWDATNLGWKCTSKFVSTSATLPICQDILGAAMPGGPTATSVPQGGFDRSEIRTLGSDVSRWLWTRVLTSQAPGHPMVKRTYNADNTVATEEVNPGGDVPLKLSYPSYDGPSPVSVSLTGANGRIVAGAEYHYDSWGFRDRITRQGVVPLDSGQTNDPFGRATRQTGPNGETTDITWDAAGRLKTMAPAAEEATQYTPDGDFLGVTIQRKAQVSYLRFNGFGEVIWEGRQDAFGIWSSRSYGYDPMGRRTWESGWMPGRGTDTAWTSPQSPLDQSVGGVAGWVEVLNLGTTDLGDAGDLTGRLTYRTVYHPPISGYWNWRGSTHYEYLDPRGRVTRVVNPDLEVTATTYAGLTRTVTTGLKYDPATRGNLAGSATASTVLIQDPLDRLIQVITTPDGKTFLDTEYRYDAGDRILQVVQYPASTQINGAWVGSGTPQVRRWAYNGMGWPISLVQPESGTTTYSDYDANGRPWTTVYAGDGSGSARTLSATYDALGRPVSRSGEGVNDLFTYDTAPGWGKGKLASASANGVLRSLEYFGTSGRLSKLTRTVDGNSFLMEWTYDTYGKVLTRRYPDGLRQAIHYRDDLGLPDRAGFTAGGTDTSNLVAGISYDPTTWNMTNMTYANGAATNYAYDADQARLSWMQHAIPGRLDKTWTYAYTDAGNLGSDGEDWYSYDLLGRLTSAFVRDPWDASDGKGPTGLLQQFAYDAFGNRRSLASWAVDNWAAGTAPPSSPTEIRTVKAQSYAMSDGEASLMAATNHLPGTIGGGNSGAAYDPQGNLTRIYGTRGLSASLLTLGYDVLGRVTSLGDTAHATSQTYDYDDEGLRIKVVDAKTGVTTYNLYNEARQLVATYTRASGGALMWQKDLVYLGAKEVAEVDAGGTEVVLVDHLGTPRFAWRGGTSSLIKEKYLPFGENLADPGSAAAFRKGFTNHEQTDASGLIYMQARFYLPQYGRFLSPDPARDQHFEQTQSWNIYSYVQNKPIMMTDPTGMVGKEEPTTKANPGSTVAPDMGDGPMGASGATTHALIEARNENAKAQTGMRATICNAWHSFLNLFSGHHSASGSGGGYVFPMHKRPASGYRGHGRQFGAKRGGRKHAAADNLAPAGTPVLAMRDGTVTRMPTPFYHGTFAMEVTFNNGVVARYGEISNTVPNGISLGAHVTAGQEIGYTTENNHDGLSMLHLELYSGASSGPLTVKSSGGFQRRSDLIDPTLILDRAVIQ